MATTALEVIDHLTVSDRLHRGSIHTQATIEQESSLLDQSGFEHAINPLINAPDLIGPVPLQSKTTTRHGGGPLAPSGPLLGERPASEPDHLNSPHHTTPVLDIDLVERRPVFPGQFVEQDWHREHFQLGPE
jgi:hypothetical protein